MFPEPVIEAAPRLADIYFAAGQGNLVHNVVGTLNETSFMVLFTASLFLGTGGATAKLSELLGDRESQRHVEPASHFFQAMCDLVYVRHHFWPLEAHQGLRGIWVATVLYLLKKRLSHRQDDRTREPAENSLPN